MAKANFDTALKAVLVHEGGYVFHPKDPGGETNKGITKAVYDAFRKRQGLSVRSVKSITNEEVAAIYRFQYWDAVRGDILPSGIDYCVFDFAVNSGVMRAAQYLQRALGVTADGQIGNVTLQAAAAADKAAVINAVCNARMGFLKRLPIFKTFGKGWTARVEGVRAKALAMK